jgi:hypothetical protein
MVGNSPTPAEADQRSRSRPAQGESTRGLQIHVSKLLLVCAVGAIAATAAVVVAAYMDAARPPPPPRPDGSLPPPPPLSEALIISVGLLVLTWLAVLVVLSRDQILHRIAALQAREGVDALEERITTMMKEYGEQRETEGYVNGLRTAMAPDAEVRQLRGVPPPARLTP